MQSLRAAVAVAVSFVGGALAQQTLVVDPQSGPYYSLELALGDANPGDTLLVEPGVYGSVQVSIGVDIVFSPGFVDMFSFAIGNVPPGQVVTVTGMHLQTFAPHIELFNNSGRVHLEDMTAPKGLSISNCAQVSLRDVDVSGIGGTAFAQLASVRIDNSEALLTGCSVSAGTVFLPVHGISATNSTLTLVDTNVTGGAAALSLSPSPGIDLLGGSAATIAGNVGTVITAGPSATPAPAIRLDAASTLRIDPNLSLVPNGASAAITGGGAATIADVAVQRADYGAPPALFLDTHADQGAWGAVFVDFPSAPVSVPALPGSRLWLGASAQSITPLVPFSNGELSWAIAVNPLPPGTTLAFQAVVLEQSGALSLTTPAVLTLD